MKIKIKKTLVFIDDGSINKNGNVYPLGSIKMAKNPVLVHYNFNPDFPIGEGTITRDDKEPHKVYAEIKLYPKTITDVEKVMDNFSGMFPSIKGVLIPDEKDKRKIGGLEIHSIGICDKPNIDERIQPILKKDMEVIEDKETGIIEDVELKS